MKTIEAIGTSSIEIIALAYFLRDGLASSIMDIRQFAGCKST
jgi:hypothetical protein